MGVTRVSHDGLYRSQSAGSAACLRIAPAASLAGRFHIPGMGKVTKWFWRIFQRRDGGTEPGAPLGSVSDLQSAGGPGAAAVRPREAPLTWVRDGLRKPQFAELRRTGGGTGGESRCSSSTVRGGRLSLRSSPRAELCLGHRARTHRRRAPVLIQARRHQSATCAGGFFKGGRGGTSRGPALAGGGPPGVPASRPHLSSARKLPFRTLFAGPSVRGSADPRGTATVVFL